MLLETRARGRKKIENQMVFNELFIFFYCEFFFFLWFFCCLHRGFFIYRQILRRGQKKIYTITDSFSTFLASEKSVLLFELSASSQHGTQSACPNCLIWNGVFVEGVLKLFCVWRFDGLELLLLKIENWQLKMREIEKIGYCTLQIDRTIRKKMKKKMNIFL